MADKEKMINWAKSHSGRLFMAGLALLLALRIFIYMQESSFDPPPPVTIAAVPMQPVIFEGSPVYEKVRRLIEPRKNFADSEYYILAQHNIFDPKLAQSHEQITSEANRLYNEAKAIYDQGRAAQTAGDLARARSAFEAALAGLKGALDRQPAHVLAQKLRTEIQGLMTQMESGAAPDATPAPGAPPATAPAATPAVTPAA